MGLLVRRRSLRGLRGLAGLAVALAGLSVALGGLTACGAGRLIPSTSTTSPVVPVVTPKRQLYAGGDGHERGAGTHGEPEPGGAVEHFCSGGLAGAEPGCPRPLKVIAAEPAGYIDHFANEEQPRHGASLEGARVECGGIDAAGCHFSLGIAFGACGRNAPGVHLVLECGQRGVAEGLRVRWNMMQGPSALPSARAAQFAKLRAPPPGRGAHLAQAAARTPHGRGRGRA